MCTFFLGPRNSGLFLGARIARRADHGQITIPTTIGSFTCRTVRGRSVSDSCRERMRPFTHRPIVIRPRLIDVEGVIRRQWPALGRPEWFTSTRVCFVACCDFDLLAKCRKDLGNLPGQAIRSAFEIGQAVANYIAYDTVTWNKVSLAGATGTTRVTSTHHLRTKTGRWCSPCSGPPCTAAPGTDGRAP